MHPLFDFGGEHGIDLVIAHVLDRIDPKTLDPHPLERLEVGLLLAHHPVVGIQVRQPLVTGTATETPILDMTRVAPVADAPFRMKILTGEEVLPQIAKQFLALEIGRVAGVALQQLVAGIVEVLAFPAFVGHVVEHHIGIDGDASRFHGSDQLLEILLVAKRGVDKTQILRLVTSPPLVA